MLTRDAGRADTAPRWRPPAGLQKANLTVVACTPHFFGDSYVTPFDLPGEWNTGVSCNFTRELALLDRADAWWFHGPSIRSLPRSKDRPWILMSMESESNYPILRNPDVLELFDIHMTYRLDSDVPTPYVNRRHYGDLRKPALPARRKDASSPVAYIASNPVAHRDAYVRELMKHIPVDALGKCLNNTTLPGFVAGDGTWHRNGFTSIMEALARYKFYLAFENSLATDYVTERLFHALASGTVPVYYGADNLDEFLPADRAVINVRDFTGPRHLAEYLLHLDRDDQAYQEYFAWKDQEFNEGFERLLDIGSIEPRFRMAVKLAHRCGRTCRCGGRLRSARPVRN